MVPAISPRRLLRRGDDADRGPTVDAHRLGEHPPPEGGRGRRAAVDPDERLVVDGDRRRGDRAVRLAKGDLVGADLDDPAAVEDHRVELTADPDVLFDVRPVA